MVSELPAISAEQAGRVGRCVQPHGSRDSPSADINRVTQALAVYAMGFENYVKEWNSRNGKWLGIHAKSQSQDSVLLPLSHEARLKSQL